MEFFKLLVVLILLQPSKADGSGVTWGRIDCGGDSSSVASLLQDGVVQVTGSNLAFAAIKTDESVVTWDIESAVCSSVDGLLQDGVVQVTGSSVAFAAIKADRSGSFVDVLFFVMLLLLLSLLFSDLAWNLKLSLLSYVVCHVWFDLALHSICVRVCVTVQM